MENETTRERGPQIGLTVPQDLIDAMEEIRVKTGITKAQLTREALWEKVGEIRRTHPAYTITAEATA